MDVGRVVLDMAMSLDGFVAGEDDADVGLHQWYFAGDDAGNRQISGESIQRTGALVMGRRTYELGAQADGFVENPYRVPHFVLTRQPPIRAAKGETRFVFVTDGVESALRQAQVAAGTRDVTIGGGAWTAQQFLKAGLVDAIQLHLIPVLVGSGKRLFEGLEAAVELECERVVTGMGATHVLYRVRGDK